MGQPALDPEDILRRLQEEHQVLAWEPLPPEVRNLPSDTNPNRTREVLEYLHANWADLPHEFEPAEAGGGFKGRLVGLFGRLTYRVLAPYLRKERDLLAHVVQVNEALERRCDDLAERIEVLNSARLRRQADEARNLTKLALWLHLDPPAGTTTAEGADVSANGRSGPELTAPSR